MPNSPWDKSRVSMHYGGGDVAVVDSFGVLTKQELDELRSMIDPIYEWITARRIGLIQIGPDSNVWPDRQLPGTRGRPI